MPQLDLNNFLKLLEFNLACETRLKFKLSLSLECNKLSRFLGNEMLSRVSVTKKISNHLIL